MAAVCDQRSEKAAQSVEPVSETFTAEDQICAFTRQINTIGITRRRAGKQSCRFQRAGLCCGDPQFVKSELMPCGKSAAFFLEDVVYRPFSGTVKASGIPAEEWGAMDGISREPWAIVDPSRVRDHAALMRPTGSVKSRWFSIVRICQAGE